MSDVNNGDWFCPNCGYLSSGGVTFNETCYQCRIPVVWHTPETQELAAELKVKLREHAALDALLKQHTKESWSISNRIPGYVQLTAEVAELKVKVQELEADNMKLRYAWFRSADYATRSLSDLSTPPEVEQ